MHSRTSRSCLRSGTGMLAGSRILMRLVLKYEFCPLASSRPEAKPKGREPF